MRGIFFHNIHTQASSQVTYNNTLYTPHPGMLQFLSTIPALRPVPLIPLTSLARACAPDFAWPSRAFAVPGHALRELDAASVFLDQPSCSFQFVSTLWENQIPSFLLVYAIMVFALWRRP